MICLEKKLESYFYSSVKHYNRSRYWKYRNDIINKKKNLNTYFKFFYIKRCDSFNCASFGTHIGYGANFSDIPNLPHGLCGIFISHNAVIGKNCKIFQFVTIGEGKNGAPIIGDNCEIGAGAKIIGHVNVGDNVKIGANCTVYKDVPSNSTVVSNEMRIIRNN